MKKAIFFVMLILLMGAVFASESSLELGQSKVFVLAGRNYEVKVVKMLDEEAIFLYNAERTEYLGEGEGYDFSDGASIAVFEYNEVTNRIRFDFQVPSIECGRFRCYPGERCTESGCEVYCGNDYCDIGEEGVCAEDCVYCGNSKCDTDEHCGTCVEDCGCDEGAECSVDSCVLVEIEEAAEVIHEEPIVEELGFFGKIWNWFKGLFSGVNS